MKRVLIPSLLIIYPLNSRKHLKGLSCAFSPFLLEKQKLVATLANRNICDKMQNIPSQFSHRITWGIDMIGEIRPTASNGHRFILVTIDYFTKWVEAASFATVTKNVVVWFIRHNLICRYGVLERIITDNGTNLNNTMITELCKQFKIQHHNSSPYRPKMKGL